MTALYHVHKRVRQYAGSPLVWVIALETTDQGAAQKAAATLRRCSVETRIFKVEAIAILES